MPEHQEHLKTPPSSADGRPPRCNVFTARRALPRGSNPQTPERRARGGETGLNIPCYRLHLSAECCLPALGLCQVQGGGKTVMHCLAFSFTLCLVHTQEVCLAVSEKPSSPPTSQPQQWAQSLLHQSVSLFIFSVFLAFFLVQMVKIQMVHKVLFVRLKVRHYFWSCSNLRWEGGETLKWQIDGHLLAYFSYLFCAVAEVSSMG